jgi:hypothetical protein
MRIPIDTAKNSRIGAICIVPTTTGLAMDPQRLCAVPRTKRSALAKPLSALGDQQTTPRVAMARLFSSGA